MLVEFPFFAAGINYFPSEISVLKVFEPRYLLLIADVISSNGSFAVGKNLESKNQVISEVKILDYKKIDNAKNIKLNYEYPIVESEEFINIGVPPTEDEIKQLEKNITSKIAKLIEGGLDMNLPNFLDNYESRINKTWDLCINSPLNFEIRESILNEKDVMKRYLILKNYIDNI